MKILLSTVIIGATIFMTTIGATNTVAAQMPPPLESTPSNESNSDTKEYSGISFGKATIPVSSGEQIIIDIPFKDGNSYKLVPIK